MNCRVLERKLMGLERGGVGRRIMGLGEGNWNAEVWKERRFVRLEKGEES